MKFEIIHQEKYSRGELLLRTVLGSLYIALPHSFLLFFANIWSGIISFIAFWAILFTGRYPQSFFEYQVGLIRWKTRVNASIYNLTDEYPAFGISGNTDSTIIEVPYAENINRVSTLLRALFGSVYVIIPHAFLLLFRSIATSILSILAFWSVLFTGKYPQSWHTFNVGTLRWSTRVGLYMGYMTDTYPVFSGKSDEVLN
jgi:hypothetical protein